MKKKIILIGSGGHAKSCIDVIEKEGNFIIAGLIGNFSELNKKILNYKVIGTDEDLKKLRKKISHAIIAIGAIEKNSLRENLFDKIKSIGFQIPKIISPKSYVSKYAKVQQGTIIMHNSIVNAGSNIGYNCIINTNSLIEHETKIGDHCNISTSATINGNVFVGESTFVGSGSTIVQSVKIGKNCFISMGSLVKKNLRDNSKI